MISMIWRGHDFSMMANGNLHILFRRHPAWLGFNGSNVTKCCPEGSTEFFFSIREITIFRGGRLGALHTQLQSWTNYFETNLARAPPFPTPPLPIPSVK